MKRLTRWIVARCIRDADRTTDPDVRARYGMLEGWVSVVANLVLAAVKLVLGVQLGSAGVIADAVHSLSDVASSGVLIFSFRAARKPPDTEHPFGHAQAEYVATLIVSVLIVLAGFELGLEGVKHLWRAQETGALLPPTWPVLLLLVGLVLVKEWLAAFSNELGEMIQSSALKADGWHHRSDSLSTGIVILGLAARNFGIAWMDAAAAVVVAVVIMWAGFRLVLGSVSPLLGETAAPDKLERMKAIANGVAGVVSAHDLMVHKYGHFYFTTVHVELSDRLNVHKMHEITVTIETRILREFPGQCVVHVDPVDLHHPLFHHVSNALRAVVVEEPALLEYSDLKLWSGESNELGYVEISVDPNLPAENYGPLARTVEGEIQRRFPELRFQVRLKIDFAATPISA